MARHFSNDDSFKLTTSHLSTCVSYLQDIKLFNSNLDVIDDAFEYLVNQESKGNKGQYFTPRYVIDMCVKMLNPKSHETMIDTASGSCGFPMHTIFHVWQSLAPENTNLFTTDKRTPEQIDYVQNNVFGIDFDARSVRVGRALNLIAGDGQTNVLRLNTLDYKRWDETVKEQSWVDVFNDGFRKLKELRADNESYKEFNFDVLMANPPFAGEITDETLLANYQLGKNATGKAQTKVGRDILFIERNLNFLKSGGRMAVVLPQGRFNNSSDKYIREFIAEHCRILAVVGLHGNVFKPHTGTKTSVLLVQKWDADICPKVDDYPIFFATMQKQSKDNSGEKIYIKDENGANIKDHHGHFIVDHDLFNHDGLTQDGIAEAFVEFAKKENLSFFDSSSFDEVKYRALLEGLEIVEMQSFQVLKEIFRLEAKFYTSKTFDSCAYFFGEQIIELGMYNSIYGLNDDGVGYSVLRMNEFDGLFAGKPKMHSNNFSAEDFVLHSLKKDDVLICRTNGNPKLIGKSALVAKDYSYVYESHLFKIRPKNELINSATLVVFLNTKYGRMEIEKFSMQGNQANFSLAKFKEIKIPQFTKQFCDNVEKVVYSSFFSLENSQSLYSQAENLLLDALGMADFSPSNENINIKSFKDSFGKTGRLDAEYYQPKYEEIEKICFEKGQYTKHIKDFQTHNSRGLQPDYLENGELSVINSRHILERELDYKNFEKTNAESWNTQIRARIYRNDILTYTTGANIGRTQVYLSDEKALASNHVNILRIENENPVYVAFVMNSKIGRLQTEQLSAGSAQQELYPKDIDNFYIPFVNEETQTKIAALIQQSFALKAESEMLLDLAKRAVEMAIEEDEAAALEFIENVNLGEKL